MIKKLYKKIRLYFINKNIKKLHSEIETKHQKIAWIRTHLHDVDIMNSITELDYIRQALEYDNMMLDSYKQDKERIEAL